MPDVDIRNYKCVPLDLLKNIGKDGQGNDIITITGNEPTLKSFKENQQSAMLAMGPSSKALLSADEIENIIVGVLIAFLILIFCVILFWGGLNLRANGLAAFQLPRDMRGLPVIAFASILFAIIGFVIGFFIKH
jgi:hypothetical protein